jgi:superfamily II DNA or RNA helicase
MTAKITPPSVALQYGQTGAATRMDEKGMRPMQQRAFQKRGDQYLLIKSPPASGKSRALMFIALDKLSNQGLKQAIVAVPERSIGGSFADADLVKHGFFADWRVSPQWNLCNVAGIDDAKIAKSKVKAVGEFLKSTDKVLVCTHATFRFAVEELGLDAFDDRLIAIDEFHHVSANGDNVLGRQLAEFIARDKVHIVAMTGSYFRGDAAPVLAPADEAKFEKVTYTYYEQLNGYEHLKALDLGYYFYTGRYTDSVLKVLDPDKKTIIHIPNVNAREALGDKLREADEIMGALGDWHGKDEKTGFDLIKRTDGRILKVANLVDDEPAKRDRVIAALKNREANENRDHVDIILALGMAKEGFDWIWCEHALTIGYRNSLTEIIQIIGRATRDAPGKTRARFTNLIAEPDASEEAVLDAVNDTLKAIAASLLMEQVLAPRFNFTPKNQGPQEGYDYGEAGYNADGTNIGFNEEKGQVHVELKGLAEPESDEAKRVCQEDLNEIVTAFVQDTRTMAQGLFDEEIAPQELTITRMGKIVRDKYPSLSETDQEAIRQRAVAALNLIQQAKKQITGTADGDGLKANTALLDGVRRFAMDVRELDIDLIDSKNPFEAAYAVLSKTMNEKLLRQVQEAIAARRTTLSPEEARELAVRAVKFKRDRGTPPAITSPDAWEKKLAEGAVAFARYKAEGAYG